MAFLEEDSFWLAVLFQVASDLRGDFWVSPAGCAGHEGLGSVASLVARHILSVAQRSVLRQSDALRLQAPVS